VLPQYDKYNEQMLILMDNHSIQKNKYHNTNPTFTTFKQVCNFAIFSFRFLKCLLWIYENNEEQLNMSDVFRIT
jgi:hypothetical protein